MGPRGSSLRRQPRTATDRDGVQRYSEAAVGMVPMVINPNPANQTLIAWFDLVAAATAAGLAKLPEDHFRVAIWADLGDPDAFRLLGCCNLNRNEASLQQLSKEGTLGGHAYRSKSGETCAATSRRIAATRVAPARLGLISRSSRSASVTRRHGA